MALGGEVHHRVGLVFLEQFSQGCGLGDAGLLEGVVEVFAGAGQRVQIGRVGQLVDVDDAGMGVAQEMAHHRRADEPGAAGDEDGRAFEAHDAGDSGG